MMKIDNGLTAYTDRYLLARDVSIDYAASVRFRVSEFVSWCGSEIDISELHTDIANAWLADLSKSGMSPWTIDGYRRSLLAPWNDAYECGDTEHPPFRLRRIKKRRLLVLAYTHEEILKLLATAATLKGRLKDGNKRSDFWQAAIHVAYSCGPRRGDLLELNSSELMPDGRLVFVQHKTGFPNPVRLSPDAMKFCARLKGTRLLPWPHGKDWFSKQFKRLRESAGVTRGTFKWIRRSAGSYAERDQKGSGARLLGHRNGDVFRQFYEDMTISGERPAEAPPLAN